MDTRRIQKTGGSTFTVSLPKGWVTRAGLKAGDSIFISVAKDGTLILNPTASDKKVYRKKTVVISDGETPEHLLRKLIGAYLAGYSMIELESRERITTEIRRTIRDFTRKVMGPEIIEETMNTVILQDISDPTELPQDKCLRRMYLVVRAMHDDAIISLREKDESIAEDVISRDSEIDKLYWMIAKQYNMILRDQRLSEKLGADTEKSLNYKLAAKIIERMGDHAAKIALEVKNLAKLKFDKRLSSEIAAASNYSLGIFDKSVSSLFKEDVAMANESIDMGEKLKESTKNLVRKVQMQKNEAAVHLVSVVESVRRTGLYATDIAEIAINHVMGLDKN